MLYIRILLQYRIVSKSAFDIDYLLISNSCIGTFILSFLHCAFDPMRHTDPPICKEFQLNWENVLSSESDIDQNFG